MKLAVIVFAVVSLAFAGYFTAVAPLSSRPLMAASAVIVAGLASIVVGVRRRNAARRESAVVDASSTHDAELADAQAEVEALLRD